MRRTRTSSFKLSTHRPETRTSTGFSRLARRILRSRGDSTLYSKSINSTQPSSLLSWVYLMFLLRQLAMLCYVLESS